MYGTTTAIAPISSLVRRSKPVYVTLDCKYRLADELHFSTVANRPLHSNSLLRPNEQEPFSNLALEVGQLPRNA